MRKQEDERSNIPSRLAHKEAQTRTRSLRFLFSGFGIAILVVLVTVTLLPFSLYAAPKKKDITTTVTANGVVKLGDDGKLVFMATVNTNPPAINMGVVGHIHQGDCMGQTKLAILDEQKINTKGNAGLGAKEFAASLDNGKIPRNWYFNIHETDATDAQGKPKSLGCRRIVPNSDGKVGGAKFVISETVTIP